MIDKEKLIEEIREEIRILKTHIKASSNPHDNSQRRIAVSNLYIALSNLYK